MQVQDRAPQQCQPVHASVVNTICTAICSPWEKGATVSKARRLKCPLSKITTIHCIVTAIKFHGNNIFVFYNRA